MSFNSWMMKNSPGSPGSICKSFGKVYLIKKRNNKLVEDNILFSEILRERYPFIRQDIIELLLLSSKNNFLLFIFSITVYQNKNNIRAFNDNWYNIIEAIYSVADKRFSQYISLGKLEFSLEAELILNKLYPLISVHN